MAFSSNIATKPCQLSASRLETQEKISEKDKHKCVWSSQELQVLRSSLKTSRLNNIRLSVLTQALKKDCDRVRNACHEQETTILKLNRKCSAIRQQNKKMKIICRAFKEDARTAQNDLKHCQARLNVATENKKLIEIELGEVTGELEAVKKEAKLLELKCEKQKLLQEQLLKNQNISLMSRYESEIADLREQLNKTRVCLEKEQNEHTIAKKALSHLRLHFAAGKF